MMKFSRDPKPEILRIEELVNNVRVGDIKLPKFQRPFVWDREDILTLWDSIYRGYPIGSILLWLTKEKLASERKIGDLEINHRPDEYPTNYLLDGQQRLSSLCGALFWDGSNTKSPWNIAFNLDKEEFFYPKDEVRPEYFPLNKLLGTFDFIRQCKVFENHPQRDKFEANAQTLLQTVKDYKIAAVRIGDMKLNEVAPIFERINSTGRQLTIVDLMRAATWSGDFDLNDTISAVRNLLEAKNFDDVPESHILRNISASADFGINKEDIDKLRGCTSQQLKDSAEKSVKAYGLAVDFLTRELPLTSYNYLPYALQLTLLVEFFRLCPHPSHDQRVELKKWFWKTCFTRHFGVSNTGQNAADLEAIRKFARGTATDIPVGRNINTEQFVTDDFRLNKAASKTYALLLALNNPRSFLDGSPVDTAQVLMVVNRNEFHHIFPKAFLRSSGVRPEKIDLLANICMLSLNNNRLIADTRPSVYFAGMQNLLGINLFPVLESHYITRDAYAAGLAEDYDLFIKLRTEQLKIAAEALCS